MKLLFEKKDPQTITVRISHEDEIKDFDYITMLKGLLDYGSLDDPELTGDFSEGEKISINSMVKQLNDCVLAKDGHIESDGNLDEDNIKPVTNV